VYRYENPEHGLIFKLKIKETDDENKDSWDKKKR
jgi:hypothetical protein